MILSHIIFTPTYILCCVRHYLYWFNAATLFDADTLPTSMLKCGVRPGPVTIGGIMTLQCYAIQVRPVFP